MTFEEWANEGINYVVIDDWGNAKEIWEAAYNEALKAASEYIIECEGTDFDLIKTLEITEDEELAQIAESRKDQEEIEVDIECL
jgi:hypothetical protein